MTKWKKILQCRQLFVDPEVRMVDGSESVGRLEVYVFGQYRTVCTNNFDHTDATVACKVLGFE